MNSELFDNLRHCGLLPSLPVELRSDFVFVEKTYSPGAPLFYQGDHFLEERAFFIVIEGAVNVFFAPEQGVSGMKRLRVSSLGMNSPSKQHDRPSTSDFLCLSCQSRMKPTSTMPTYCDLCMSTTFPIIKFVVGERGLVGHASALSSRTRYVSAISGDRGVKGFWANLSSLKKLGVCCGKFSSVTAEYSEVTGQFSYTA